MADIRVQRGVTDFGASEDSFDVTLGTAVDPTKAFARITNVAHASAGPTAGSTSVRNNDDLGATVEVISAGTKIRFARCTTGVNEDVRVFWEVWEYVGPAGGPNEFLQRGEGIKTITSGNTGTVDISGHSVLGDVVPILTGQANNEGGTQTPSHNATLEVLAAGGGSNDRVEFHRRRATGRSSYSYAFIEFTGSNWVVEQNVIVTISTLGGTSKTITDVVDWARAWIESSYRNADGQNALVDSTITVWPGTTTTTLKVSLDSGADGFVGDFVAHCFVIRNDELLVDHYDSVDGAEADLLAGSSSPQAEDKTITTLDDLAASGLVASATTTGTGTAYGRQFRAARLKDASTIEWWRGRHGNTARWAAAVIRFPVTLTPDPAVLTLSAPAVTRVPLTPEPAVVTLVAPTADVTRQLIPTPAVLTLVAPAVEVPRIFAPDPAVVVLAVPIVDVLGEALLIRGILPAVLTLRVPSPLLDIPGRRIVEQALPIAPTVERELGIARTVERTSQAAPRVERDLPIARTVDRDAQIARTVENPPP